MSPTDETPTGPLLLPPAHGPVGQAPPPTPAAAHTLFGDRVSQVEQYVALLADTGLTHGLIGPREAPRLWERHVLGCAVLTDIIGPGVRVADVGAGAGLPGLVLALRRPDLHVTLVEPLHRRVVWLQEAVARLGLGAVDVHEGRAESLWGRATFDVVTARAVARIGTLAQWCLPLVADGGRLLALKGASAATETSEDEQALRRAGASTWEVLTLGSPLLDPPATVVAVSVPTGGVVARKSKGGRPRPTRTGRPPRGAG